MTLATRMAAYIIGHIQEFDPEKESFINYKERIEFYFQANEIANEKKVAVLLSVIGTKNYALLRDLMAPDELTRAMMT